MGASIIALVNVELAKYQSTYRRPETVGERLDRELREQEQCHQHEMRRMQDKIDSTRRLALMGYYD